MNETKLLRLKDQIEEAQRDADRFDGQMSTLMDSLKSLGYSSIEKAKEALEKLEDKIEKQEGELQKAIEKVEEQYEGV